MYKNETKLKDKVNFLPDKPGVYLMKDNHSNIIYVGKALNLKKRIKSYFSLSEKHQKIYTDVKTQNLVTKIKDFDYIITNSEIEAILLETNLIKEHRPKYNITLKDDKSHPFLKITMNENFPRIFITRDFIKDGAKYFGPYTDVYALRQTLKTIRKVFKIRYCKQSLETDNDLKKNPCVYFQMNLCSAPCINAIDQKSYRKMIDDIVSLINGNNSPIIESLTKKMDSLAEEMKYEEASEYRDKINYINKIRQSQNIFFSDEKNRDVIGIYKEEKITCVSVIKIIAGKMINREIYQLANTIDSKEKEILSAFLKQYYSEKLASLPNQIILQIEPDGFGSLNHFLKNKLHIPQRGESRKLVFIAKKNAFDKVESLKLSHLRKSARTIYPVQELKEKLKLRKLPRKIVCFDISTIQGSDTVASLVFFDNGKPLKKNYRHYIIKSVEGQNDFASMEEVMKRYLNRIEEQEKPDLIVIDGGKGQLSSATKILQTYPDPNIEIISLAKKYEEIYLKDKKNPIVLSKSSSALKLLVRVRDESHHFALTFHQKKRKQRTLTSELDQIKGINDKKKFLLLRHFGSVKRLKEAKFEDLLTIRGIGEKTAELVISSLKSI